MGDMCDATSGSPGEVAVPAPWVELLRVTDGHGHGGKIERHGDCSTSGSSGELPVSFTWSRCPASPTVSPWGRSAACLPLHRLLHSGLGVVPLVELLRITDDHGHGGKIGGTVTAPPRGVPVSCLCRSPGRGVRRHRRSVPGEDRRHVCRSTDCSIVVLVSFPWWSCSGSPTTTATAGRSAAR